MPLLTEENHMAQQTEVIDLAFADHGSVWLMTPVTPAGYEWVAENIPEDAPKLGNAIGIENRFVMDIVKGASCDGLACGI